MRGIKPIVKQLRQIMVGLLAAVVFLTSLPIASAQAAPANSSDRGSDVTRASDTTYKGRQVLQDNSEKVGQGTIKKIQQEAEDLGDKAERSIGDTGLKNIRKLGENIPETADLKARQTRDIYSGQDSDAKNLFEQAKDKVEDVVDSLR